MLIKEKEIAIKAVVEAMVLAQQMQEKIHAPDILEKEDGSPVTVVDIAIQAILNQHLVKAFPEDEIMGEESGSLLKEAKNSVFKERLFHFFPHQEQKEIIALLDRGRCKGGPDNRFWVIDPIDGTYGFIRNEQYAIALALIVEGEVVLGVLGCPRLGEGDLYVAVKGEGCEKRTLLSKSAHPVHVSCEKTLDKIIYCEPHITSRSHSHAQTLEIAKKIGIHPVPMRLDSQCRYALVANGEADIYFRVPTKRVYVEKIWDHAPGSLIVEEAGGRVTDLLGHSHHSKVHKLIIWS